MKNTQHICFHTFILFNLIISCCLSVQAQEKLEFTGKQFFAVEVANTDSSSAWYEDIFKVKLLKEIKTNDQVHIRIVGNENMMIEILQTGSSKSKKKDAMQVDGKKFDPHGFFKIGFYVKDITKAEKYFKSKNVKIEHSTFKDDDTRSMSFILEGPNNTTIQVLQSL